MWLNSGGNRSRGNDRPALLLCTIAMRPATPRFHLDPHQREGAQNSDSGAQANGRNIMGRVFFRCPQTGEDFDSGFQAGPGDLRLLPAGAKINLRCRVCGVKHEFLFADARVDETEQNRLSRSSRPI